MLSQRRTLNEERAKRPGFCNHAALLRPGGFLHFGPSAGKSAPRGSNTATSGQNGACVRSSDAG